MDNVQLPPDRLAAAYSVFHLNLLHVVHFSTCRYACLGVTAVALQIAASSLETLFQQLTSPRKFRDDFVEVS